MPGSTLEVRAHLVEFCRTLARAMVEAPWYSPSHADARKSVEQVWQTHRKLVEGQWGCHEVHLLTTAPGDDGAPPPDGLVAGVEAEPVPLSVLLHGTMGEHLHHQMLDFFTHNQLVSLAFRRSLTRADLEQFIVEVAQRIMSARRTRESDGVPLESAEPIPRPHGPPPPPLGVSLRELHIDHIGALHLGELLEGPTEGTPWLVHVNLSRTIHELRAAQQTSTGDPEQRAATVRRIVTEGFLSLGASWLRQAYLVAASPIQVPGGDATLATLVVRNIPENVRTSLAWELIGAMDDPAEAEGARERSRRLLGTLASGIQVESGPASADLLLLLHRRGVVAFDDLPEVLKDRLRVRGWTDQFLENSEAYLARLHVLHEPAQLRDYLTAVRFIFRELLARSRHPEALLLLRTLQTIVDDASEPADRRELVQGALDWIRRVDVAPTLAEAARTEDGELRRLILSILQGLGPQVLFPLLTLLGHVRTSAARKDVCDAIRDMGPAVVPMLVEELLRITHPWFLHRNILMLLGELGATDAARDVRRMLEHPHIRVREQAASTLVALLGEGAEPDLVAVIGDGDRDLQLRIVSLLTDLGSGHPRFREFLRGHVATLAGREDADETLVSQCLTALGSLAGQWTAEDRAPIEDVLFEILDPPLSRALIRRAQGFRLSPRVREQAVRALCAVASPRARSLLTRLSRDSVLGVRQAASARLATLAAR